MPAYTCPGTGCGQGFLTQRGLSMHTNRCLKYKRGIKHNLSDYKRVLADRSAQLPTGTNQPSVSGLQVEGVGGVAPVGEARATQSRVDSTEEVNPVCIHKPSQPESRN